MSKRISRWVLIALCTLPALTMQSLADANPQKLVTHSNFKLCSMVAKALRREQDGSVELFVASTEIGGRTDAFQGIDLDGDGKQDSLIRGCGSASNGTCTINIELSGGGGYELTENFFTASKFQSKYYVVVGNTYPNLNSNRRLYALTSRSADLVCKSF